MQFFNIFVKKQQQKHPTTNTHVKASTFILKVTKNTVQDTEPFNINENFNWAQTLTISL